DDDEVDELTQHWLAALTALAAHVRTGDAGGLTPSDVPLVSVTQSDLEMLEERYDGLADVWSLAPLQSGLLFHASLSAVSDTTDPYVVHTSLGLTGNVDPARLRRAAQNLIDRNPGLRTAFAHASDGTPVQVVVSGVAVPWTEIDLSDVDRSDVRRDRVQQIIDRERRNGFEIGVPPLLRFILVAFGQGDYQLLLVNHHIVLDGWSMPLLLQELLALYALRAQADALPPARSYRAYLDWLSRQDTQESMQAWKRAFHEISEPSLLSPSSGRDAVASTPMVVEHALSPDVSRALDENAVSLGVTMNTVVQAAWGIVLSRMTGQSSVVFGATVSGRPPQLPGVESTIGMFINTLPVGMSITDAMSIADLLDGHQSRQVEMLDHHYVGLADIQREVGPAASFDTLVVFESYPVNAESIAEHADLLDGMKIADISGLDATSYPLSVRVTFGEQLNFAITYQSHLFDEEFVRILVARFTSVFDAMAHDMSALVSSIDISTEHDQRVLQEVNETGHSVDPDATLVSLFYGNVDNAPDRTAVVAGDIELTYRGLSERVNRLARILISWGVGPETHVAVAMGRGVDTVVCMYAVLAAGGAYVPIDPAQPRERTAYILGVSEPVCVLTTTSDGRALPELAVPICFLEDLELSTGDPTPISDGERIRPLVPQNSAYVIFTSGSTGRPKGVAVPHRAICNQLEWFVSEFGLGSSDVLLLKAPMTFDVSVLELFSALTCGGCLVIARPDGHRDPRYISSVIDEHGVTLASFVPSMLDVFVDELSAGRCRSLRVVLSGGEELLTSTARRFKSATSIPLFNLYGPTETTVQVTCHQVELSDAFVVPIGRPVWNTRVRVLDDMLREVPVGAAGELYISGAQVARGYVSRPDLAFDRFIADPYADGARMYRTGDLVRMTLEGDLEYLGRTDFQVKIRGLRIELGEIESVLREHQLIDAAAVAVRAGKLVAYVTSSDGSMPVDAATVLRDISGRIPAYMVPDHVMTLGTLPSNASGKLDRKALPEPHIAHAEYDPPVGELEREVASAFEELLGGGRIGRNDDFFALGGNSLSAMKLAAKLSAVFGIDVPIRILFASTTVASLAERIGLARRVGFDSNMDEAIRVMLPIRKATGSPVFCVHPIIGLAWSYSSLSPYIDDASPIYGLQTPVLTDESPIPTSLESYIERYVTEIRAVQPEGPYRLLGWSLGGVLAQGIAARLEADGDDVARLILLDCLPEPLDGDGATFADHLRGELASIGIAVDASESMTGLSEEAAEALLDAVDGDRVGLTAGRLQRLFESYAVMGELVESYRPRPSAGDALLIRSNDVKTLPAQAMWKKYISGCVGVESVDVPHEEMLSQDGVRCIGPVVARALADDETTGFAD
ncbi:MAG: amino acid adenylation domain-containing protein, partial [Rhodococcus sp.]|nr:amino acid adenylation domain-containing protein [Rhodococcus sp. (in: high G+C Gram-positive bacteria)]